MRELPFSKHSKAPVFAGIFAAAGMLFSFLYVQIYQGKISFRFYFPTSEILLDRRPETWILFAEYVWQVAGWAFLIIGAFGARKRFAFAAGAFGIWTWTSVFTGFYFFVLRLFGERNGTISFEATYLAVCALSAVLIAQTALGKPKSIKILFIFFVAAGALQCVKSITYLVNYFSYGFLSLSGLLSRICPYVSVVIVAAALKKSESGDASALSGVSKKAGGGNGNPYASGGAYADGATISPARSAPYTSVSAPTANFSAPKSTNAAISIHSSAEKNASSSVNRGTDENSRVSSAPVAGSAPPTADAEEKSLRTSRSEENKGNVSADSILDAMTQIADLRQKGIISEEEYQVQRAEILSRI